MNAKSTPAAASVLAEATHSRWITPLELTFLGAIWGSSFLFMRIATVDFGPFALIEMRLSLGALMLLPFLWRERATFRGKNWAQLALVGVINSALPFTLFAWGAERAPAGIGAIMNAMAVIFAAVVAFFLYGERIGPRRLVGLVAGLVGVAVLASGKISGSNVGLAVLAGGLAAFFYGIGANLIKHHLTGVSASAAAASTLLCAAIIWAPLAVWTWPTKPIPTTSWACAVTLGLMCTGFAFAVFYRLIRRIGGPTAATVTYIVPLFGVIWAWLFLGEQPTASMGIAGVLILIGVALSQQPPKERA